MQSSNLRVQFSGNILYIYYKHIRFESLSVYPLSWLRYVLIRSESLAEYYVERSCNFLLTNLEPAYDFVPT
jgi:hypothetical protein